MIVGPTKFDEGGTTMAEDRSMTAREAANNVMAVEHADVLRESVAVMVREIMESEIAQLVGAEHSGRAPGRRSAQRNGYRDRRWDTRVGEIELAIPRLRTGSYLPSFLEPRRRAEQALVAVVQEAYVNGVSTRKVDRLVEQMGLRGLSKDQVSRMCRGLDEQVQAFRERPLEGAYPYLWLDAKIERVREPGGVRQKALVIAYAVHESGIREVLGLDVGEAEGSVRSTVWGRGNRFGLSLGRPDAEPVGRRGRLTQRAAGERTPSSCSRCLRSKPSVAATPEALYARTGSLRSSPTVSPGCCRLMPCRMP